MHTWRKDFADQPAFAHLKPWLDSFNDSDWPDLAALNVFAGRQNLTNANGLPLRFSPQAIACGQHEYESVIHASGCVPSRERNWHDLFNALIWLAFPETKAALNLAHQSALRPGCNRAPASDAATLFDESGVALISADAELIKLLAARRWREALVDRRDAWSRISIHVIGHALLEKMLTPWPGITAKCLFLQMPADSDRAQVDAAIAWHWRESCIPNPATLFPLPLLGIPGWWPPNEDPEFYQDRRYFRLPRPTD